VFLAKIEGLTKELTESTTNERALEKKIEELTAEKSV